MLLQQWLRKFAAALFSKAGCVRSDVKRHALVAKTHM